MKIIERKKERKKERNSFKISEKNENEISQ